jgi:hypothetical protein
MLAYVSWHRAAPDADRGAYEQALERFHRSLAHRPPSGLQGSASFRTGPLPWFAAADQDDYEDWYLLDGWSSLGVLEEATVSRGHLTAHDAIAGLSGISVSGVYRLNEGHAGLAETRVAVWVERERGHQPPSIAALLGDGMDRQAAGLWRRCVGLGPAPEFCLLAPAAPAGVASARLPAGWKATVQRRELLWASGE